LGRAQTPAQVAVFTTQKFGVLPGVITQEPSIPRVKFSDWVESNPTVRLAGTLVIGLLIGYFAGREHVKYEIKTAMSESLASLGAIFGGKSSAVESKAETQNLSKPKALSKPSPISATLMDKGFYEEKYGQNQITMDIGFLNGAGADVRAFDGVLIYTDLLGNEIIRINVAINEPVAKGATLNWSGGIDYNQFKDAHKKLRNESQENIKSTFVIKKILFADGRLQEF
jgi:hypothetical protein